MHWLAGRPAPTEPGPATLTSPPTLLAVFDALVLLVLAFMLAMAASGFGLSVMGRLVTGPIASLSNGVERLRSGAYDAKVRVSGSAELAAGDRLRVGTPGVVLELVAVG